MKSFRISKAKGKRNVKIRKFLYQSALFWDKYLTVASRQKRI